MLNAIKSIMLPMADRDDRQALQQFAWQMGIAFPLVFGLLLPWIFDHPLPVWPFLVTASLLISAYLFPPLLYPLYCIWMVIASILGWMNTQLILALAFFVLILPLGLVLRLFGKLGYKTALDQSATSYWITRDNPPDKDNLKEPF